MSEEIPVVEANVIWKCPGCGNMKVGKTIFRCFTRFAVCPTCDLRIIPNLEEETDA